MRGETFIYHLAVTAERHKLGKEWSLCPQCGQHRFVPYVDAAGEPIAKECGRCNRENNCGYFCSPKEYFSSHPEGMAIRATAKPKAKPKTRIEMPVEWVRRAMLRNSGNVLLKYLRSLPWHEGQRRRLEAAIEAYGVGTDKAGSTIWWQIDEDNVVRSGKQMVYKEDGHRSKKCPPMWVHCAPGVRRLYPSEKYEYVGCLFGQHLLARHEEATVYLVESEKSALICSAFYDMDERVWLACGGLSHANKAALAPILARGRRIVACPDHDGYDKWRKELGEIDGRVYVDDFVERLFDAAKDSPSADIADVSVRLLHELANVDEVMTNERLFEMLKEKYEQLRRFTECVEVRLMRPSEVIK